MKERLRKEAVLQHHRRDLVVVGVLAIGVAVGLLYLLGVGRGADERQAVEETKEWREAVARAASADEIAAKLASRSKQDEAERTARVIGDHSGPLAPDEASAQETAALARCMRATASLSLLSRMAKDAPDKGRKLLAKQKHDHLRAARELCASTVEEQQLCLAGATSAAEIAACSGARLSPKQRAILDSAAKAIVEAEPELAEDGTDPSGKSRFAGKKDSSYKAILNDMLAKLPESDRAKARELVDGAMREHVSD